MKLFLVRLVFFLKSNCSLNSLSFIHSFFLSSFNLLFSIRLQYFSSIIIVSLSFCLSFFLSFLAFSYLSIYLSIYLSSFLFFSPSTFLSLSLYVSLSLSLYIYIYVYSFLSDSFPQSIYLSIYLLCSSLLTLPLILCVFQLFSVISSITSFSPSLSLLSPSSFHRLFLFNATFSLPPLSD